MNETVARIVELLFEDVEMNDEVRAIHDEVMNNCQERFGDLLGRGLSEDEAITAVVESLKGMEEVLAGYPKKAAKSPEAPAPEPPRQESEFVTGEATFPAEGLKRVAVSMMEEDVRIEESPDGAVRVINEFSPDARVKLRAEMVGGELRVRRVGETASQVRFASDADREKVGEFTREFFAKDFKWEDLGELVGKLVRGITSGAGGNSEVRVQIPRRVHLERLTVNTTGGDVDAEGLSVEEVRMESRSGDLRVALPEDCQIADAEFHTTSGDVEARLAAVTVAAQSMSGDIRFEGAAGRLHVGTTSGDVRVALSGACERCELKSISGDVSCRGVIRQAAVNTTSGDINLDAACETVSFGTVSGDVQVNPRGAELRAVDGHTTSGDVTVHVPGGVREADVHFRSVSGDVYQSVASVPGAVPRITVNTVSGDLRVR